MDWCIPTVKEGSEGIHYQTAQHGSSVTPLLSCPTPCHSHCPVCLFGRMLGGAPNLIYSSVQHTSKISFSPFQSRMKDIKLFKVHCCLCSDCKPCGCPLACRDAWSAVDYCKLYCSCLASWGHAFLRVSSAWPQSQHTWCTSFHTMMLFLWVTQKADFFLSIIFSKLWHLLLRKQNIQGIFNKRPIFQVYMSASHPIFLIKTHIFVCFTWSYFISWYV